jgi:hypothetical protein
MSIMDKREKMTIKQAVINVCNAMYPGEKILGYELYERVLAELWRSGNFNRPLSDTVLRRFREVRDLCGMESHPSISEYTKKIQSEEQDGKKTYVQHGHH